MASKRTEPTNAAADNESLSILRSQGGDADDGSSLLLDEGGGLTFPGEYDEEAAPPSVATPPPQAAPVESATRGSQDLGFLRLDDLGEIALPNIENAPAASRRESAPPPESDEAPPTDVSELSLLLMDEEPSRTTTPAATIQSPQPPAPPVVAPTTAATTDESFDETIPSALLIPMQPEAQTAPAPVRRREPGPEEESEITFGVGHDLSEGRSSLLIGDRKAPAGGARAARGPQPAAEPKRFWKRKRERIKVVLPKPDAPIQWFSNADACAVYCRKHSRPLLLYFTTGDLEQCQTYETAIRQPEMQPFLSTYVCCMINLSLAEGRQVAMRLGVPTDGPGLLLLSPSGREYARVLKPEVDWHFLATVLFWALR